MKIYQEFINGHLFQPYNTPGYNKTYDEIIFPGDSDDIMIDKFNNWYARAYEAAISYNKNVPFLDKIADIIYSIPYNEHRFQSLITGFIKNTLEPLTNNILKNDLVKNKFIKNMLTQLNKSNIPKDAKKIITSLLEPDLLK